MAHLRERGLTSQIRKQLNFWPIVTVLGPRQSGKSTFLRELVFDEDGCTYVNLDRIASRNAANQNPESFLAQMSLEPVVIDEAHKAPALFDEIKAVVDEDRRPGRFILTGSVRFSSKVGIRESFTGRAANLRFDSMTLPETHSGKVNLKAIHRYLRMGGMPAVCFLRDEAQIERYWIEWLEAVCQRDLHEAGVPRLSGDLAYRILESVARLDYPSSAEIATNLRVDARRIRTHIDVLESLFLLRRWEPDSKSVGKTLYLPFDCGLASHLGASLRRKWQVLFAHHVLNEARFFGKREPRLEYNKTARGSFVDFVFEDHCVIFSEEAYPSAHFRKTVNAVEKRLPRHKIQIAVQTDQSAQKYSPRTTCKPWAAWLEG